MHFKFKSMLFVTVLTISFFSSATEQEELTLVLKQIQQVKQSLIRSEIVSSTGSSGRYHFNYAAAQEDLNQIAAGIERYLAPERAQPRPLNFPVIAGEYNDEGVK